MKQQEVMGGGWWALRRVCGLRGPQGGRTRDARDGHCALGQCPTFAYAASLSPSTKSTRLGLTAGRKEATVAGTEVNEGRAAKRARFGDG